MQGASRKAVNVIPILVLIGVGCILGTASAREIWVDWSYDMPDANGTEAKPYPTINTAIANAAVSGDIIKVKAGVYHEDVVIDRELVLSAVSGPDLTMIVGVGSNAITIKKDNAVTVERFTVTTNKGCGIELEKYSVGRTVTIRNIVSKANSTFGFYKHYDCNANVSCINCTFVLNSASGVQANDNSVFTNCLSTDNNSYGFRGGVDGYGTCRQESQVRNSCAYNNGSNYQCVTTQDNIPSESPEYMNLYTGDYRLAQNSPCRNAGTAGAYLNPDGSRNDIGAYGGPGAEGFYESYGNAPVVRDLHIAPGSAVETGTTITITATGEAH